MRKGREKGKAMCNKTRNQNKLKGQRQMDILKNTTRNQIYSRTFNNCTQELKGGFLSSQLLNITLKNS